MEFLMSFSPVACPWHILWFFEEWRLFPAWFLTHFYVVSTWQADTKPLWELGRCLRDITYGWAQELSSFGGFKLVCRKASKVCAPGVPQMPTDAHKGAREEITPDLCTVQEVRVFCPKMSKGREIGVYCFELKSKQQLMEWCHITSPKKEEFTECIVTLKNLGCSLLGWEMYKFHVHFFKGDNSKF